MRAVFVHLRYTTEQEVTTFLDHTYPFQKGPNWILENAGSPVLYIDFYRDLNSEFEVEAYLSLLDCLNGEPTISVVAEVSGRYDGTAEVYAFVCALLCAFQGVAQDDYSDHCWSREEIQKKETPQGQRFFDFKSSLK